MTTDKIVLLPPPYKIKNQMLSQKNECSLLATEPNYLLGFTLLSYQVWKILIPITSNKLVVYHTNTFCFIAPDPGNTTD